VKHIYKYIYQKGESKVKWFLRHISWRISLPLIQEDSFGHPQAPGNEHPSARTRMFVRRAMCLPSAQIDEPCSGPLRAASSCFASKVLVTTKSMSSITLPP
jgi:hypothetical protein